MLGSIVPDSWKRTGIFGLCSEYTQSIDDDYSVKSNNDGSNEPRTLREAT